MPNTSHARVYASGCNGDVAKLNVQSPDSSSASPDGCHLPSYDPGQCKQSGTDLLTKRSFSDPLNEERHQRDSAVLRALDNDRENDRMDTVSSELIHCQKIIVASSEELSCLGDRKDKSPESIGNHADIVYQCAWASSRDSYQDSGCMSDLSSGGGDSPSATVSPNNDQASDDDYVLTKHLNELQLDRNGDAKQQEIAGDCVQRGVLASIPLAVSVQTSAGATPVPRYVRPMREIPPRFRRLLAAEAERVVRLCQRLNGSPLYSAATPTDGTQPTNDSRETSSDNQAAFVDKPFAGQTSYSSQSPLIYVTAQSSGLPVYPPASGISVPLTSYSNANAVEPTSYVVPVGVADASPEALPPTVPMLLANPAVFYYPSAPLPPPDVASAFSYVVQTPVVSGCPQPGTMDTGGLQSAPGYVRNAQSDHINVAADAAAVGVFQSATNDGCSSYCYQSPGQELLPCCSLQMMQA